MGEIAEMMLDGTLCEGCGEYMGDEVGFPRLCSYCDPQPESVFSKSRNQSKVACPTCGRHVKAVGLAQHQRDAHGSASQPGDEPT